MNCRYDCLILANHYVTISYKHNEIK